MSRLLGAALLVAIADPAAAQPKQADRTAMYEDVEVMRRLLADAFTRPRVAVARDYFHTARPLYGDPINVNMLRVAASDPYGMNWSTLYQPSTRSWADELLIANVNGSIWAHYGASAPPPPTDGTYLKGVGPVFNLTLEWADAAALEPPARSAGLAANCAHCHGSAMDQKVKVPPAGTKRDPPDPWEATLRQVRGEKDPPTPESPSAGLARDEVCVPGILTELALNTVSAYGHRFRELPPGDRITVAITVKPAPKPAADTGHDPGAQARAQADEQLALGDLHAKQGKSEEAVAAYRKAVEILTRPLSFLETAPHEQVTKATEETTRALRAAHGKLAQALLTAGKLDDAKAAIEAAKGATVSVTTEKAPPAPPAKPPLPTKLTMSIARKAIDDHKAGKLNVAELRAAAEVEAVGFPIAGVKSPKP